MEREREREGGHHIFSTLIVTSFELCSRGRSGANLRSIYSRPGVESRLREPTHPKTSATASRRGCPTPSCCSASRAPPSRSSGRRAPPAPPRQRRGWCSGGPTTCPLTARRPWRCRFARWGGVCIESSRHRPRPRRRFRSRHRSCRPRPRSRPRPRARPRPRPQLFGPRPRRLSRLRPRPRPR